MAALVRHLQLVGDIGLLARLDDEIDLAVLHDLAAGAIGIDDQTRIDQIAMLFQQERGPVLLQPDFLVGGEGDDDVAVGDEAFLLQTDQRGRDGGILILHVRRAAAVEIAVLLGELERRQGPVLGLRLDHVHVADPHHGLALALAVDAHDDVDLMGIFRLRHDMDVGVGEAAGLQIFHQDVGDALGADVVDGMHLDDVAEDVVRELLVVRRRMFAARRRRGGDQQARAASRRSDAQLQGAG